jgi:predicted Zn finger-like uncharacterized protein
MIVKCEQCQTRFKIPDEKVTDKGVKVRCTKCQNTFRVTRDAAAPPVHDPFALFGEAPAPEAKVGEITRPGFFKEGVEATKAEPPASLGSPGVPWHNAHEDVDEDVFREPTRVVRLPLPPEGAAPPATTGALPFDPPPTVPAARPAASPPPRSATAVFGSLAPAAPAKASARPAPPPPAAEAPDPFFDIDEDEPTVTSPPSAALLRKAASVPPSAKPPAGALALGPVRPSPAPAPLAPSPEAEDPFAALDFGDLDPAPAPTPKPAPAPAPARVAAAVAKPAPAPAPEEEDPFASLDFGDLDAAPAPAPTPAKPPAPAPAPVSAAKPPAPAPVSAKPPAPVAPPAPAKPPAPVPAAKPAAPAPKPTEPDHSLFGSSSGLVLPDEAPEFKVSEPSDADAVGRKEVLDLPAMPELPALEDLSNVRPEDLPDLSELSSSSPALPSAPISKPVGRQEEMGLPEKRGPGRARRLTGLVINVAVAAVLVVGLVAVGGVYLREGRLDLSALSPSRLQSLGASPQTLVARDISNGLYDTKEGSALFFVRGEVENRGTAEARVKVRAALYDGDQRVKSQEGLAGAVPTPEDLYAITSTEGAAALRTRLDATAPTVPAGGRAPFVLVFQEYPAELDSFRLEVTLEPVSSAAETGAPQGAAK